MRGQAAEAEWHTWREEGGRSSGRGAQVAAEQCCFEGPAAGCEGLRST